MNKSKSLTTAFFILFIFTTWIHAQQENKFEAIDVASKSVEIKSKFSLKTDLANETANRRNSFAAEAVLSVPSNFKRQQPYVRPTKKERFNRYASDAFGVPALIGATFGATFSHIGNNPPEWEKNIGGFGKRFASSYGTNAIRNTISYGISEAFKLDNRFERSGQKNFGKRLKHVFISSYTTRTKSGRRIPDFPHFIGTYSAAVIANETWFPKRFGYKDGLRDGTISLGTRFGVNLLREFFFSK